MAAASVAAVPLLVVRLPADYFVRPRPPLWTRLRLASPGRAALLLLKNLLGGVLLLLGLALGRFGCQPPQGGSMPAGTDASTRWTCSMDPQVLLPQFGDCPICGMDLIPLVEEAEEGLHPSELRVSENAAALAGGFTYRADEDDIEISRGEEGARAEIEAGVDTFVQPGDVIRIEERLF